MVMWYEITTRDALVQIMAWRRPGDKPLSEPMTIQTEINQNTFLLFIYEMFQTSLSMISAGNKYCLGPSQGDMGLKGKNHHRGFPRRCRCLAGIMMTPCHRNAFRIIGPLWGEPSNNQWVPLISGLQCEDHLICLLSVWTRYWTNRLVACDLRRRKSVTLVWRHRGKTLITFMPWLWRSMPEWSQSFPIVTLKT